MPHQSDYAMCVTLALTRGSCRGASHGMRSLRTANTKGTGASSASPLKHPWPRLHVSLSGVQSNGAPSEAQPLVPATPEKAGS